MPPSKSPAHWNRAKRELSAADPIMGAIIKRYKGEALQGKADAFHTLLRSITGQQISVKAADAVWGRLEAQSSVKPKAIASLDDETLRTCGYSRQKVAYIRSLCEFFLSRQHLERDWAEMTDEEVITDLTQIKGIGRWTAEMFLLFHLLRPDVFPVDDLGVLKAMRLHYSEREWNKKAYLQLAATWQPWRSVATWYLWRSLDPVPVAY
jgi:DNA-3-methyladenine glycosylase II